MQQWTAKFKHTVQEGKKISKKQETVLCQAVSYGDVESFIAKFIEAEGFTNPSSPDISKFQTHEILGFDEANVKQWWKFRIKCVSEDDKGKVSIFYTRYLVYADDITKALKLVSDKEKSLAMSGEIESGAITKIDYMLISIKELASI